MRDRILLVHPHQVFLAGSTGYIGSRLAAALLARAHAVRALAREASLGIPHSRRGWPGKARGR